MANKTRYHALDLLRFIAALAVVLYHYTFRGYTNDALSAVRFDALGGVTRYGYLGVDLFFVISGFVIAMSMEGRSAGAFLVARARRLYPALWIACALTAIASWAFLQPQFLVGGWQFLANLTLFADSFGVPYVDGAYWSLDVEVRFYLMVTVLLLIGQSRRLTLAMVAWMALAALHFAVGVPSIVAKQLGLRYAPLFVAGVVYSKIAVRRAGWLEWGALAAAIPLSIISAVGYARDVSAHRGALVHPAVVVALLLAIHGAFSVIAVMRRDLPAWGVLATLGGMTYPLYLVHQYIGYMVLNASSERVAPGVALSLLLAAMVALSWLIFRYAEPAVRRLFDRAVAPWRVRDAVATT